jgi:transposase
MAEPVRARRLSDHEGQTLQRLVRRGKHDSIQVRRALIVLASAGGTPVTAIAQLVAADEDTVRDVIHAFNERGLSALDPNGAGGRPRRITSDDDGFIVATATTRPEKLGRPFTRWSIRELLAYLADDPTRIVVIGRERLRQYLREHPFPEPVFCLRSVRAAVDPAVARLGLGARRQTRTLADHLPARPGRALLSRLLQPGR